MALAGRGGRGGAEGGAGHVAGAISGRPIGIEPAQDGARRGDGRGITIMEDAAQAPQLILAALGYLLAKHMLADFFLQTPYQYRNKGRYGHPGGLVHVTIHLVLTTPVFLILPPVSLAFAGMLLAGEGAIHYHMDWAKERMGHARGWTPEESAYWRVFGVDQLVHGLTYIAMVGLLVG